MEILKELNTLFYQYKCLIDFEDSMQKNNFKFVDKYLKYQQKKKGNWEEDCVDFLKDVISLQKKLREQINVYRADEASEISLSNKYFNGE